MRRIAPALAMMGILFLAHAALTQAQPQQKKTEKKRPKAPKDPDKKKDRGDDEPIIVGDTSNIPFMPRREPPVRYKYIWSPLLQADQDQVETPFLDLPADYHVGAAFVCVKKGELDSYRVIPYAVVDYTGMDTGTIKIGTIGFLGSGPKTTVSWNRSERLKIKLGHKGSKDSYNNRMLMLDYSMLKIDWGRSDVSDFEWPGKDADFRLVIHYCGGDCGVKAFADDAAACKEGYPPKMDGSGKQ